jgi:hypothetical protein
MFVKAIPNAHAFAPLPKPIYDSLGGIEKSTIHVLSLSRLIAGAVFGEQKQVELHTGASLDVGLGQTWCSITSIQEDLNAATGNNYSRMQVRYALEKLESGKLFASNAIAKGKFGKRFTLNPDLLRDDEMMIDVIKAFRIFYYGDVNDFTYAEKVVTEKNRRGTYTNVENWIAYVAKRGIKSPAFTTVGRWRRGEAGQHNKPVFVPWISIDVDRPFITDAYDAAYGIAEELYEKGFDTSRCFVSFSGMKGFHISISTDQIGSPIFYDSLAARETIAMFTEYISSEKIDPHVNSPLSLIRLTGSIHETTGNYKRTWTLGRFLNMPMQEVFADLKSPLPFVFPDPTKGAVENEVHLHFRRAAEDAASTIKRQRQESAKYGSRAGGTISRILMGVDESEQWHDKYCGRNWAAFILACWLFEAEGQQRQVCDVIGYQPDHPFGTADAAFEILSAWNSRNTPPIAVNELRGTFKSAQRKVLKGIR